jgi:Cysteine rich repeat
VARRIAWWFFIVATLFGVPSAFAQTGSPAPGPQGEAVAKFQAACGQDLRRFCTGVQPGEGRIIQCLMARRGELSAPCRSVLAQSPAR